MSKHRTYVAGFLLKRTQASDQVLLVRKSHPDWQAGLMNGIGGEVEPGESIDAAMMREFWEEARHMTNGWEKFAVERGPGYEVWFYRLTMSEFMVQEYTAPRVNDKGEELEWRDARNPKYPVIGNLNWLLPLALDPRPIQCVVETQGDIRSIKTW